jgi:hypothetical protein
MPCGSVGRGRRKTFSPTFWPAPAQIQPIDRRGIAPAPPGVTLDPFAREAHSFLTFSSCAANKPARYLPQTKERIHRESQPRGENRAMLKIKRRKRIREAAAPAATHPATDDRRLVKFEYLTAPGAAVYLVGSFNNWNPAQTRLCDKNSDGCYRVALDLESGTYEYKFVVDGQWRIDLKCPDPVVNRFNTLNGVITVN